MSENLTTCQNGHVFSKRRYGTVCPYCNSETATRERQETGMTQEQLEEELFVQSITPVCGWIVCVSGARQGKDYRVKSGKNFIGRADDMDIQILGDEQICRRNHGVIVFDPKKKETVLLPGESNGIVYLNDAAVYTPQVLNPFDVIELGESKFLFVPFCGEHFMWEDKAGKQPAMAK